MTWSKGTDIWFKSIPVLCLIGVALIFFREIAFQAKPLFGLDFVSQFYPWKKFIYDRVWSHGAWPFWNPYLLSGMPFITNMQASMFYPLGFLYYLVPPQWAYGYATIMHCILGSLFMYLFMRGLSASPAASLIAAFVFSFNGYFMGHLYAGHLSFVQNYVWLPLIFFLLMKFGETRRFKYAVGGGLILGVQILGGFPQIAFYTLLGGLLFCFFSITASIRAHHAGHAAKMGLGFCLFLVVGFALAAVQVLPTAEFMGLSTRAGGVNYAFATYESLNPKEILAFLVPDIYGNPIDRSYWRSKEFWHFWESCGYAGILPLFLIFIKTASPGINRIRMFFVFLMLLSLFLALGRYNPLYPLVYKLPGFDRFRIPAQIIFLYVFSVAVLSGLGFHAMEEKGWRFGKGLIAFSLAIGAVLVLFVIGLVSAPFDFFFQLFKNFSEGPVTHANLEPLYQRISGSVYKAAFLFLTSLLFIMVHKRRAIHPWGLRIGACALVIADLYLFGAQFVKTHAFPSSPDKQTIVSQLNRKPHQGRVVTRSPLFLPNDGLLYEFPSLLGYDPLLLRRYVHYIQSSQNQRLDDHVVNLSGIRNPDSKLLQLLNANQVVMGKKILDLDGNTGYLRIVKRAVAKPDKEALAFMKSDAFDPEREVLLEENRRQRPIVPSKAGPMLASGSVTAYDHESIRIQTASDQPGYLVLSEIFYPGWQATVDGKKTEVIRGNYLLRVIPLDKGRHDVHLYFVSWPFRIGAGISLLTLIACLGFVARKADRKAGL
jgi:hypothetical protein